MLFLKLKILNSIIGQQYYMAKAGIGKVECRKVCQVWPYDDDSEEQLFEEQGLNRQCLCRRVICCIIRWQFCNFLIPSYLKTSFEENIAYYYAKQLRNETTDNCDIWKKINNIYFSTFIFKHVIVEDALICALSQKNIELRMKIKEKFKESYEVCILAIFITLHTLSSIFFEDLTDLVKKKLNDGYFKTAVLRLLMTRSELDAADLADIKSVVV